MPDQNQILLAILISCLRVPSTVADTPSTVADTPAELATALLAQMTLDEKISMVHGVNSGAYVGNTAAIDRLGIPALTMNDGPQGFRSECCPGTTTQYPAAINIAATFDPDAALIWGTAMGEEFVTKGSNVQLGPGLNVARVPLNGRNFEYLSGEDPFLGAYMVASAVEGIQSQGVIANAKHYVNNNQETNRQTVVEVVDERTQWELYMPPFISAVDAGVGSFMCSYNNVSTSIQQAAGTSFWACENYETLTVDLKQRMGFDGWVMSDWGATHSTVAAAYAGLDQEMPSSDYFGQDLYDAVSSGAVNESLLDDKVLRILTIMETFDLMDSSSPTNNGNIEADATSDAHRATARELASMSSVLLKNDNNILPLSDDEGTTVAVLGNAAALGYIAGGGGSGEVTPSHVVSLLEGIYNRFGLDSSNWGNGSCTFLKNVDYYQPDSPVVSDVGSQGECCDTCAEAAGCAYYTYEEITNNCWLKFDDSGFSGNATDCVSGSSGNSQQPLPWLTYVPTGDLDAATAAAAAADIVIIAVATSSSEGSDRATLSLSDDENDLVAAAAAANANSIVVANAPGALLMPWASDVAAILMSFMPGEQGGAGQTDVLYGDVNPSARLPITIPNRDNEIDFSEEQYPGVGVDRDHTFATYSEELLIGYRWYNANNVVPNFAFGHGLSYTVFSYSRSLMTTQQGDYAYTVSLSISNTGDKIGSEVAQLYLGFPSTALEPPMQLKGISKVTLEAGADDLVVFDLSMRDFSIWDVETHDWTPVNGTFTVYVGAASDDIRATASITV